MNGKVLIIVVLCSTGLVNLANAQNKVDEFIARTTLEERAELQTSHMKEALMLTDDQVIKVQEINLKYAGKMSDAYHGSSRKIQRLRKMKSISSQKDKDMKAVLSPSQYADYEKNKDEVKEKLRAKAKENRSGN